LANARLRLEREVRERERGERAGEDLSMTQSLGLEWE